MQQHEEAAATGGLTGWPHSEFRKRKLDIRFTGSGSEYFRIWIVNLLLTIVTATLYWPFAKARRIRYFYANTLVDGHALSFHGDPWKMFRGHVLLMVLTGTYSLAGHFSPLAGLVAFGILALIWPALWRAGLQFRLGNTAWRGLRLGFGGSLKGAYAAFLPLWIMSGTILAAQAIGGPSGIGEDGRPRFGAVEMTVLAAMLVAALCAPWIITMVKRYQHRGYRIAGQQGEVSLSAGSVYWLCLKAFGLSLALSVATGLIMIAGMAVAGAFHSKLVAGIVAISIGGLGYILYFAIVGPFFTARFQNLLWNATTSQDLSFTSQLHVRPLAWLTCKNWLLTAITLGLYRPFAVVHTTRLRLEAVSLTMDGDAEAWVASQASDQPDAAGEFAGDFFGIDMGL
ncbi:YjgN family protein [Mitsuaria sp. GD03876]|uniref:YjgN family protein n=1 Tax=Mitsuaria sp. GD03876 TaxID=2975399 RepID=UPI00244C3DF3|nr:YjgN family protein [Mitsuaria sp. GD03876]MDH0864030.1 YjgN family protein [Mitsuaria sp. GD03876]